MPTCYCKQKLAKLAPPPGSSDWSTVLELTLMSGSVCKNSSRPYSADYGSMFLRGKY